MITIWSVLACMQTLRCSVAPLCSMQNVVSDDRGTSPL